ncbi:MAG: hypothetical protein R3E48_04740 [Burkholderiaceae bacterium]
MSAALLGLVGLFALIFARVPIAVSLAVVGFVGFRSRWAWSRRWRWWPTPPRRERSTSSSRWCPCSC